MCFSCLAAIKTRAEFAWLNMTCIILEQLSVDPADAPPGFVSSDLLAHIESVRGAFDAEFNRVLEDAVIGAFVKQRHPPAEQPAVAETVALLVVASFLQAAARARYGSQASRWVDNTVFIPRHNGDECEEATRRLLTGIENVKAEQRKVNVTAVERQVSAADAQDFARKMGMSEDAVRSIKGGAILSAATGAIAGLHLHAETPEGGRLAD